MNAENRPPFVTGLRRCGRTEAMLNRIMENIRRVNFQCPDLSTWRLFARSTEEVRSVIFPRLLQKIEAADIKHRWCSDSSERILLEIIPYGPNILIGAMPPVLEQRKNTNVFYDHAATEWHLREMLWQLKEDIDTASRCANSIAAFRKEYLCDWSIPEKELLFEPEFKLIKRMAVEPTQLLQSIPFVSCAKPIGAAYDPEKNPAPKVNWKLVPQDKEEIDGKTDDKDKKND